MPDVLPDEVAHLVMMASKAPSVHNTQPWLVAPVQGGLRLRRDHRRRLDVIDPSERQLLISCGAFLHHLEVAARALGIDPVVTVDAQGDDVATIRLERAAPATEAEIAAAVAILHRHTHRGRFDDRTVTAEELGLLVAVVTEHDELLRVVRAEELTEVEVLLSRAERALHQVDGYDDELARWVWHHDEERADGLPRDAVAHGAGRAESLAGREFEGPVPRPGEPPAPERPSVVLLSSVGDAPSDWVQSGRALSALLLAATQLELLAQPLGQVIDLPGPRRELAQRLGVLGSPQLLLRIGHGTSQPTTPRRSPDEVLARA